MPISSPNLHPTTRRPRSSPPPPLSPAKSDASPHQDIPEPGGPGQSLPVAGILAISAAIASPSPDWLSTFLPRVLAPHTGLRLPAGARAAILQHALEVAASPDVHIHAADALNGYLSASAIQPSQAVPLTATFLHASLANTTLYDARAREALLRFVTALRLPPRILYHAEAALAALVHSLAANARSNDGTNTEAVAEDDRHARRRRSMKWLKVGAAGVVGGLALGLSGGLIAPALLPALSGVGLASVSAPLTALGSGGAVAVGGLFGAAGAGVGAAAMAGRTGVVDEFRFEACSSTVSALATTVYRAARLSPRERVHDVCVPWAGVSADGETGLNGDGSGSGSGTFGGAGGLLVWELLTSQDHVMVVPGLMSFRIGFRPLASAALVKSSDGDGTDDDIEWLLPEERMDAGGFDRERGGVAQRRRTTGAFTVQGSGEYILRLRLMPGSLAVNVSYRVAVVPPGRDPPLWVMEESEQEEQQYMGASDVRSLSMAIFVPGLVTTAENGPYPGMCADQFVSTAAHLEEYDIQCFALRWDTELLMELSDALRKLIGRMALSMAAQNGAMMVVPALVGVVGAVALPVSIIAALRTILGNIWAKTLSHAEECGYMLAAELASRSFGNRPVTLAGYSAGAVVVFSCLRELARRKLVGIVHDVCLIGAPCTADVRTWREVRSVVSGRLINVYNDSDWYLELYHRGTNLGSVAGTRAIVDEKGISRVENVQLDREMITNHTDYAKYCSQILMDVGIGNVDKMRPWERLTSFEEISDSSDDDEDDTESDLTGDGSGENGMKSLDDPSDDVVLFNANGRRRRGLRRSSKGE